MYFFVIIYLGDYMREYISSYVKYVDKVINDNKYKDDFLEMHLKMITYFQHERVIHLVITLFYAILTLLFWGLCLISLIFIVIALILSIFLVLYIYHYFYLENHVQYMYKQYNKLKKLDFEF